AELAVRARDEIPDAALQHQAERLDDAVLQAVRAAVADLDPAPVPDRFGELFQMGDGLRGAEPARCVEVEALRDARCSRPELRREGGKDLELRGAHDRAETELRGRAR